MAFAHREIATASASGRFRVFYP